MAPIEAAIEAARLRFRPIIMTSMAFILGVVPLVIASGAGAASRHSIGTGVFGGMLAATFLGDLFRAVVLRVDQEAHGPDPGAVARSARTLRLRKGET